MENKLFGLTRLQMRNELHTDKTWIPIKTGVQGSKLLKSGPNHIMDATQDEPLYHPQENILEDCLKREAERVGYSENLINKVVYDC